MATNEPSTDPIWLMQSAKNNRAQTHVFNANRTAMQNHGEVTKGGSTLSPDFDWGTLGDVGRTAKTYTSLRPMMA